MGEDFGWFLILTLICFLPFSGIYLLLYTLDWNEKKNLFSDSWFVFLTWLFTSISIFIFYEINRFNFHSIRGFGLYSLVFVSIIVVNIFAIAGVLYLRSRKEKSLIITNYNDEKLEVPNLLKTLRTSAIVSFLTLMMVVSLFLALEDFDKRFKKDEPINQDGVSFGFYEL